MKKIVFKIALLMIINAELFALEVQEPVILPNTTYKYAQRDTCELFLDFYEPAEGSSSSIDGQEKPLIVFMFGGGFVTGSRNEPYYTPWFKQLTENGYRVVSIDYRLGLKGVEKVGVAQVNILDKAIHMAVEDLFSATAFLIEHADSMGINPNNIVLSGSSAGAISVLQADYELSNRTSYASSLPEDFKYAGVMAFAGAILSRKGKLKYAETPAPTLLMHGTKDKIVTYKQIRFFNLGFFGSDKIAKRFSKLGYDHTIIRYAGQGHKIAIIMDESLDLQLKFIENHVLKSSENSVDVTIRTD